MGDPAAAQSGPVRACATRARCAGLVCRHAFVPKFTNVQPYTLYMYMLLLLQDVSARDKNQCTCACLRSAHGSASRRPGLPSSGFRFPRTARARRAAARPGGVVCRARGRRETPAITIGAHAALPGETFASINKGKCPTLNSRHMYTRSYSSTGPGRRVSRTRDPRSLGPHITPLTAAARAEAHSSLTTLVASAGPEAASGLSRRWSPRSILYGRRSSSRVSM